MLSRMGSLVNIYRIAVTFLLVFSCAVYGLEKGKPHDTVIDLTDETFDDMVTSDPANGLWLLKFYAPWCGHCKTLAPTLDKVANFIQGKMAIGKIDCTKQTKICKRFEVKGYPTLKVYRDGVFMNYPGERHADAFITFGERLSKNAISLIQNSQEAFDLLLSKSTIAFVAYDPKATIAETGSTLEDILQSTSALQVFNQIARKQQVFASFGLLSPTITKEQFLEFGFGKKYNEEAFFAKIEKDVEPIIYNGEMSSPEFLDFVKFNNHPLVAELGAQNFRALGSIGPILAIGVVNPSEIEKAVAFQKELKAFAASAPDSVKQKYIFAWIDGVKFDKFLKQFGIEKNSLPQVFALDFLSRQFWQDASVSSIKDFIEGVESGEIAMQKQAEAAKLNALQQIKFVFMELMPWSLLFVVVMFVLTIILFLPEKREVPPIVINQPSELPAKPEEEESKKDK